jgi:hypothetical protein
VLARKNNEEWNEETAEKYAKDVRFFYLIFSNFFYFTFCYLFSETNES